MDTNTDFSTRSLGELEEVYFGDWDRCFKRAGNSGRAAMDMMRVLLVMAADIRRLRELVEQPRGR